MTDLFDAAPAPVDVYEVRAGRYRFPAPPGERANPRGWMRMTNLASAFSDQKALQRWLEWKSWMGLRDRDVIFDEWMAEPLAHLDEQEQIELVQQYAERARVVARADEGARRGTALHEMMDAWFSRGEATGTRAMALQRESALEALDKADLDVVETEFYVWHPAAGGAMGKSDVRVMCRRTGQVGILDWKTQARFWTWQEVCGQLYGYDSAPWVWRGPRTPEGRWERTAHVTGVDYQGTGSAHDLVGRPGTALAGKRIALVAHMPQAPGPGQLPVTIKQIPLEYGREVLECAARNVQLRSYGKSVKLPVEDFPA